MKKLNLEKRSETLKLSLEKKSIVIGTTKLRVAQALDISGSMQHSYTSGEVSEFVGKLLPFGCLFDDNSEIDNWAFNSSSKELPPATPDNYDDYVGIAMRKVSIGGGTSYAPVITDIYDFYFGEKEVIAQKAGFIGKLFGKKDTKSVVSKAEDNDMPSIVFFTTDGECSDLRETVDLLKSKSHLPVYFVCVGIGNTRFQSLQVMKDSVDNVDFISVESLSLSDEDLYDKILSGGLTKFIEKHKG